MGGEGKKGIEKETVEGGGMRRKKRGDICARIEERRDPD